MIFLRSCARRGATMKNLYRVAAFLAFGVVLSGCTIGVELGAARGVTPTGSTFNKALYAEYIDRSQVEYSEGDYDNSDLFALKAMRAAGDNYVVPERVEDHTLPQNTISGMTSARQELVEALSDNGRKRVPYTAARAQRMFDCWVEEQEENRQPFDIATCREAFWDSLREMQKAIMKPTPKPVAAAPEPELEPEPEPAAAPPSNTEVPMMPVFFVLFDFDSASLDAKGISLVENIAKQIIAREPTRVFLSGHTDRAGSNAYNQVLSERRAQTVANVLLGLGVNDLILTVSAMSESDPRVETADGVRERQNRFVRALIIP